jgi:hypothetical protein
MATESGIFAKICFIIGPDCSPRDAAGCSMAEKKELTPDDALIAQVLYLAITDTTIKSNLVAFCKTALGGKKFAEVVLPKTSRICVTRPDGSIYCYSDG